ncbi:GIY-YIG nuclease family protein [Clostridium botulinum]|uniref:GIY-YIG nuclease family protein n=1 Tax=Clostridium botulinum TaxID=1491 RepID=UPI000772F3A7|nr:GIY-YIG nuclease family protein [Clostridium botulinum]AUM91520.1 hypothetical protein RSJ5_09620 [Clostridium botulinum]NFB12919.1 hypothetical protein [Clostridium botulinum]NFH57849.1 hypothetical protein [Clostridium botulinum]NFJ87278.1 hypothetical protein [Clostridium botulinum]NFV28511.1 hypothetical protein [Clostridium botulinum]
MSFGIYSIINLNTGKMYIGQTRVSFEDRWRAHRRELQLNKHYNEYLQRAWNKYGDSAFEFKVIHICDELDILNDLEIYYVKKYNTFDNGYNLTSGGDNFEYELDEDVRLNIIEKLKEKARDRSEYTDVQIARLKQLLVDKKYCDKVEVLSKMTGVGCSTISSVKALKTWVDVRSDLNEKIKELNDIDLRNNNIVKDFINYKLTIKELIEKYKVSDATIRSALKASGLKDISTINKDNDDLKLEDKILDSYYNGIDNFNDMEKVTGASRHKIDRLLKKYDLSIRKYKKKKSTVKNINWDENSKRYLIRLTKDKKQIVIGGVKDLEYAIQIRDKAKKYIDDKLDDELEKLINSLKSNNNLNLMKKVELTSELEKYNKLKPKYIRVDSRPKQLPRFEVYIKGKYSGSSKLLDEAIKIRDNILKESL